MKTVTLILIFMTLSACGKAPTVDDDVKSPKGFGSCSLVAVEDELYVFECFTSTKVCEVYVNEDGAIQKSSCSAIDDGSGFPDPGFNL